MNTLWQRVCAFDRRHPLWWDVAPVALMATISLGVVPGPGRVALTALVVAHAAGVLRRRLPWTALLVATAATGAGVVVATATGVTPPWTYLLLWVLLFGVGLRDRSRPVPLALALTALTVCALTGGRLPEPTTAERLSSTAAALAMGVAGVLGGVLLRTRHEQRETERAEIARSAALQERTRIAGEMHDVVGHDLAVIASLAAGGAVAARGSPEAVGEAFEAIGQVSRGSLREVRRTLGVLQPDSGAAGPVLAPPPGLADVATLVETVRSAGLGVRLERSGDLDGLSPGRELALYRIVQESLTNVIQHGGARAEVDVRIEDLGDHVAVTVSDDGPAADPPARPSPGSGHGIAGMRERARAYGGRLEAGPSTTGWRVHAVVPRSAEEDRR